MMIWLHNKYEVVLMEAVTMTFSTYGYTFKMAEFFDIFLILYKL